MKYYVPDLKLSVLLPKQIKLEDKLGGLPWGMPQERWPFCKECNNPMLLVAQFCHNSCYLDLGKEGRVLHVFECGSGGCETWSSSSGANECFFLESDEITESLTVPPGVDAKRIMCEWKIEYIMDYIDKSGVKESIPLQTEARVQCWIECNDDISDDEKAQYLRRDDFWGAIDSIKYPYCGTKLGGVPCWVQEPELEDWTYIIQLSEAYDFYHSMPSPDEVGCPVGKGNFKNGYIYEKPKKVNPMAPRYIAEKSDEIQYKEAPLKPIWNCEGPSLGTGVGYIFILPKESNTPECCLVWQCS